MYPQGYTHGAKDKYKAYKMSSTEMNFAQAKKFCEDEGSVLAMPRTEKDIEDIKQFDRKCHK